MIPIQKLEKVMSFILIIGTVCSAGVVLIGGILYLMQHGNDNAQLALLASPYSRTTVQQIGTAALSLSPQGIIMMGIVLLVMTQILRVSLLAGYYAIIRDYWFTAISLFILLVLIYSFAFR